MYVNQIYMYVCVCVCAYVRLCLACMFFLIIGDIIFRGNTQFSGHGSSDFPRLECVSEHREDVRVCVCVCASLFCFGAEGKPRAKGSFSDAGLFQFSFFPILANQLTTLHAHYK